LAELVSFSRPPLSIRGETALGVALKLGRADDEKHKKFIGPKQRRQRRRRSKLGRFTVVVVGGANFYDIARVDGNLRFSRSKGFSFRPEGRAAEVKLCESLEMMMHAVNFGIDFSFRVNTPSRSLENYRGIA